MRSFDDPQGKRWQAALLDASYGNILLIFSPLHGEGVRQSPLGAENMAEAMEQLAAFDEGQLCSMLAEADPWEQ